MTGRQARIPRLGHVVAQRGDVCRPRLQIPSVQMLLQSKRAVIDGRVEGPADACHVSNGFKSSGVGNRKSLSVCLRIACLSIIKQQTDTQKPLGNSESLRCVDAM